MASILMSKAEINRLFAEDNALNDRREQVRLLPRFGRACRHIYLLYGFLFFPLCPNTRGNKKEKTQFLTATCPPRDVMGGTTGTGLVFTMRHHCMGLALLPRLLPSLPFCFC